MLGVQRFFLAAHLIWTVGALASHPPEEPKLPTACSQYFLDYYSAVLVESGLQWRSQGLNAEALTSKHSDRATLLFDDGPIMREAESALGQLMLQHGVQKVQKGVFWSSELLTYGRWFRHIVGVLLPYLHLPAGQSVLHVGGETGILAGALVAHHPSLIVDVLNSPPFDIAAAQMGNPRLSGVLGPHHGVHFLMFEGENISMPREYDRIIAIGQLRPDGLVKQLEMYAELLKPGGKLLIVEFLGVDEDHFLQDLQVRVADAIRDGVPHSEFDIVLLGLAARGLLASYPLSHSLAHRGVDYESIGRAANEAGLRIHSTQRSLYPGSPWGFLVYEHAKSQPPTTDYLEPPTVDTWGE